MEREESTLPDRSWDRIPYDNLHEMIVFTQGGICDPDYDLERHEYVHKHFRGVNNPLLRPYLEKNYMGHNLTRDEIEEMKSIVRRYAANQ